MTRYIMIDNYTGFVWGDVDVATPEEACTALDLKIDPSIDRKYEEMPRPDFSNETGYFVYDGTGFDINSVGGGDGQSAELIEAVKMLPMCAYFKITNINLDKNDYFDDDGEVIADDADSD